MKVTAKLLECGNLRFKQKPRRRVAGTGVEGTGEVSSPQPAVRRENQGPLSPSLLLFHSPFRKTGHLWLTRLPPRTEGPSGLTRTHRHHPHPVPVLSYSVRQSHDAPFPKGRAE